MSVDDLVSLAKLGKITFLSLMRMFFDKNWEQLL